MWMLRSGNLEHAPRLSRCCVTLSPQHTSKVRTPLAPQTCIYFCLPCLGAMYVHLDY